MSNSKATFGRQVIALAWTAFLCSQTAALAQDQNLLKNSSFESGKKSWVIDSAKGLESSPSEDRAFDGSKCLLIDSSEVESAKTDMVFRGFQRLKAESLKGKRIRLTGAARTEELQGPARLQLSLEYGHTGNGMLGMLNLKSTALDDMSDRPIRSSEWTRYEIVADVPDDALNVSVGWKLLGRGKAWVDDFKLEEVSSDVEVTGLKTEGSNDPLAKYADIMPLILKARQTAHLAPKQPFFNHWLWLAAFSLALFLCAAARPKDDIQLENEPAHAPADASQFWKFALRFSIAYWALFLFAIPVEGEFKKLAAWANYYYKPASEYLIYAVAQNAFGIEGKLTPPLGSGDTTYSYIHVLIRFLMSLALAVAWSLVDWRRTNYRITHDLFLSYLRYTLAVSLLVYGLIKVQWSANQFPELFPHRLDRNWGDTSPMGVVWNFMGASRPYTVFAGLGELIAGLLLVFRRTSVLGALAAVGVMTNVVMLNYCYDVPVKILSTHLLVMAFMLLVASADVFRPLFFMKPATPRSPEPAYYSPLTRWFYFPVKAAIVIIGFAMPCWNHFSKEASYIAKHANSPAWLDEYSVAEFRIEGDVVSSKSHQGYWKDVEFAKVNRWSQVDEKANCVMTLRNNEYRFAEVGFTAREDNIDSTFFPNEHPTLPQGKCKIEVIDDKQILLKGNTLAGNIEVLLDRDKDSKHLIYERGFRWISEVPFNR